MCDSDRCTHLPSLSSRASCAHRLSGWGARPPCEEFVQHPGVAVDACHDLLTSTERGARSTCRRRCQLARCSITQIPAEIAMQRCREPGNLPRVQAAVARDTQTAVQSRVNAAINSTHSFRCFICSAWEGDTDHKFTWRGVAFTASLRGKISWVAAVEVIFLSACTQDVLDFDILDSRP